MSAVLAVVRAADRARSAALRRVCALRPLRPLVVNRGRRLIVLQLSAIALAGGMALLAPLVSLWLGAALLGVPHVIAGTRAVALRRRTTRLTLVAAGLGALVGVTQIAGAGDGALRAFVVLFAAAIAWEIAAARRSALVSAAALAVLAVAARAAWSFPALAVIALAHLHGLGALAFFALCARRRGLPSWPLLAGALVLMAAAAGGLLDGAMVTTLFAPRGAARSIVAEAVGASLTHPTAALFRRALFLYAFGQSLHFAVWLRLMPELDRPSATPKPFLRALRELEADFGRLTWPLLLVAAASVIAMLAGGGAAREIYFALTYFHVGLEAAALARLGLRAPLTSAPGTASAPIPLTPAASPRRQVAA